jgi:hypothetical protein
MMNYRQTEDLRSSVFICRKSGFAMSAMSAMSRDDGDSPHPIALLSSITSSGQSLQLWRQHTIMSQPSVRCM